jgi:hypothetical protein
MRIQAEGSEFKTTTATGIGRFLTEKVVDSESSKVFTNILYMAPASAGCKQMKFQIKY